MHITVVCRNIPQKDEMKVVHGSRIKANEETDA